MKNTSQLPLLVVVALLSSCVADDHEPGTSTPPVPTTNLVPRPTFKSLAGFDSAARQRANPFHLLPDDAVQRLRQSLVFEDGRVVAMDYREPRSLLPPDRYLDLMAALGFWYSSHPMFAGIDPPHPSAPQPARDYCPLHGPPPVGAEDPPPAILTHADAVRVLLEQPSPLDWVSEETRRAFMDSLEFSRTGLATFDYDPIESELTPDGFADLLSLFGLDQEDIFRDHKCIYRGTCEQSLRKVCAIKHCSDPPQRAP